MVAERSGDDETGAVAQGRAVLLAAADHLRRVADALDASFVRAVASIVACRGKLVVSGVGKAGHVARKLSATFASTGTHSIDLHPSDALHGDLGRVLQDDVVLVLSHSGVSEEIVRLLTPLRSIGARILAITGEATSPLGREADVCLAFGRVGEAGHLGLAPTTSTTLMLALGDALAMAVAAQRDFTPAEFARFHPAGAIGRSLMRVSDVMRRGGHNPVAKAGDTVIEVLHVMSATPGRPGAASLVDAAGRLVGFYTDGDFRRRMELAIADHDFSFLEGGIDSLMTRDPLTIGPDRLAAEAMHVLRERKIDQLPVVDGDHRPIGLVDVQDLLEIRVLT
jgi:arabinose-5-phosphate isomerase